jgi:hypothetical protein
MAKEKFKVKLLRGLEVSKNYGRISRFILPNKSRIYISKKGWTLITPDKKETLLPWAEIQLALDESIVQGYVKR